MKSLFDRVTQKSPLHLHTALKRNPKRHAKTVNAMHDLWLSLPVGDEAVCTQSPQLAYWLINLRSNTRSTSHTDANSAISAEPPTNTTRR